MRCDFVLREITAEITAANLIDIRTSQESHVRTLWFNKTTQLLFQVSSKRDEGKMLI